VYTRDGFDNGDPLFMLTKRVGTDGLLAMIGDAIDALVAQSTSEYARFVRIITAYELKSSVDYPFFNADYADGETADDALARLFNAERGYHDTDFETVLVMCHG
jgi:hypothetical protein